VVDDVTRSPRPLCASISSRLVLYPYALRVCLNELLSPSDQTIRVFQPFPFQEIWTCGRSGSYGRNQTQRLKLNYVHFSMDK